MRNFLRKELRYMRYQHYPVTLLIPIGNGTETLMLGVMI